MTAHLYSLSGISCRKTVPIDRFPLGSIWEGKEEGIGVDVSINAQDQLDMDWDN